MKISLFVLFKVFVNKVQIPTAMLILFCDFVVPPPPPRGNTQNHPPLWQYMRATPLNSTKKAEEKMIMSSVVWSHIKDLLHHAALKIHLMVSKFQENFHFIVFLLTKFKYCVSSILRIPMKRAYGCYCDSSKHDINFLLA